FLFDSGLHTPLIIRFPEKFSHLAPLPPGSRTDQIVSYVDLPPTMLSLTGLHIPEYMQGHAFLGDAAGEINEYAYSFRGRMDERIDMSRSIRDKQFRYTLNFMPHKIYGQYLAYLWRAPSMQSWEDAYQKGQIGRAHV